jgi:YfiH family protein
MTALPSDGGPGRSLAESPAADPVVPRVELTDWWTRFGLVAGITTRALDFSLGLWSEEPSRQVMTRWQAFRTAFAEQFPTIILGHQIHGAHVEWHDSAPKGWLLVEGMDGHATGAAGVLLTVTVADCIPIYLAQPRRGVVALLHAGWRGVASGILERGLEVMLSATESGPEEVVMHCGIGICGGCYEVGSEVQERLARPGAPQGSHVDLRRLLEQRARALGVTEVTLSPFCTFHDHDRFYSHRASRGRDGRMVAYLGRARRAT